MDAPHQIDTSGNVIPVVILNWNGEEDTLECLKSIKSSASAGFALFVVDNGSNPESLERLKRGCSLLFSKLLFLRQSDLEAPKSDSQARYWEYLGEDSLVFIENRENLGFARGNNVGIRFAELVGSEWVLLLNNDTVVAPEAFRELRKFLNTYPAFMAVTPQIRHYQPNDLIQNCGGDLTYFGSRKYKFANMNPSVLGESDHSVIAFITGCALLFNHKVAGPLSEDFFFGEEDYEFSLRMKKRGLKMACAHRAVVYHKQGSTIAMSSKRFGTILVNYVNRLINTRNYYSWFRWNATRILAYLYLPLLLAKNGISPRHSISAIRIAQSFVMKRRAVTQADFQMLIRKTS